MHGSPSERASPGRLPRQGVTGEVEEEAAGEVGGEMDNGGREGGS
jgi:hypothetical protein